MVGPDTLETGSWDPGPWLVAAEKCRICGYECVGVIPIQADLDNLECGGCGNMTSEVVEIDGEDDGLDS